MKGVKGAKNTKVNSLSLAKVAAQLSSKLEFDLQPFLQDKVISETLEKISASIVKLDSIKPSENIDSSEIAGEFHKTDKNLEKVKDKVNHLQEVLNKIEKTLQEKLIVKVELLKKTEPKDATDLTNREKVETFMKSIKQMIESAKKKLKELQEPTEQALKKLHAIKPKLYALGIPDTFDRCQKKAEKLSEELGDLYKAVTEMILNPEAAPAISAVIKHVPIKLFLPKLKSELEKSSKLLEKAGVHLTRLIPQAQEKDGVKLNLEVMAQAYPQAAQGSQVPAVQGLQTAQGAQVQEAQVSQVVRAAPVIQDAQAAINPQAPAQQPLRSSEPAATEESNQGAKILRAA